MPSCGGEWAALAAQHAAEKAIKALIMAHGDEPSEDSVTALIDAPPGSVAADPGLTEAASRLGKHYILRRYPNGFASGFPGKLYTRGEAEGALKDATEIIEFCRRHLPR